MRTLEASGIEDRSFRDGELFAVMDMNLPEGFLLARLRERAPKQPPTKMQVLALMGSNGIGRVGFQLEGTPRAVPGVISRDRTLLRSTRSERAGAER
ncbi:MAG: HipA N-terminal domain-containing protein [Archangium sp.]|nr:HipA N-terminal domain-containing protein [Archangium sp.]